MRALPHTSAALHYTSSPTLSSLLLLGLLPLCPPRYHWWSKIGVLYDALRSNATPGFQAHPDDGWLQHREKGEIVSLTGSISRKKETSNRMMFKQGPQWDLPSMDYVLFTGDGAVVLEGVGKLNPWFRGTLELASQPHTRHFFNEVLGQLNDWHYVCSRRVGMLGAKNKIFTGRSDAWLWRHYAYKALGLGDKGYKSHPRYPPRKVCEAAWPVGLRKWMGACAGVHRAWPAESATELYCAREPSLLPHPQPLTHTRPSSLRSLSSTGRV